MIFSARTRSTVTQTFWSVWGIDDVDATRLPSRTRQDADGRFASDPSLRLRVTLVMLDKDADISRMRSRGTDLT
jgi:hypothetical protein